MLGNGSVAGLNTFHLCCITIKLIYNSDGPMASHEADAERLLGRVALAFRVLRSESRPATGKRGSAQRQLCHVKDVSLEVVRRSKEEGGTVAVLRALRWVIRVHV